MANGTYAMDIGARVAKTIDALRSGVQFQAGKAAIGTAVQNAVKENFLTLNALRSKGYSKNGFYQDAANNTTMAVTGDGAQVQVNKLGVRLRLEGGTVTAGKGISCKTGSVTKYLTIPAIPEAYGKPNACYFGNLQFVKFGRGDDAPAALVEREPKSATVAATGKKVRNKFPVIKQQGQFARRVFFWLVKSTTHKPDPSILPPMSYLEEVAVQAAEKWIGETFKSELEVAGL